MSPPFVEHEGSIGRPRGPDRAKKTEPGVTALSDLDDRLRRLEKLVEEHRREPGVQFQRPAQLQAEFDTLGGSALKKTVRDSLDDRRNNVSYKVR